MRTSRLLLLLSISSLLVACTPNGTNGGSNASSSTSGRSPALEGEFCGGIAAFQCAAGLTCKYDGNYPDAGGTCVKS